MHLLENGGVSHTSNPMNSSVKIRKGVPALVRTYNSNLKLFERCFQVSAHLGRSLEIEGEESNVRRAPHHGLKGGRRNAL